MKRQALNQFFMPHNVVEDAKFTKLPHTSQILYMHLCRLKNRLGDKFYRSVPTLAKDTGLAERTIHRAKRSLVKAELIGVDHDNYKATGHRRADIYHLNGFSYKLG